MLHVYSWTCTVLVFKLTSEELPKVKLLTGKGRSNLTFLILVVL